MMLLHHVYEMMCSLAFLLQEISPFERQIQRDLARTFPEHSFFKERDGLGQEALLNILKVSCATQGHTDGSVRTFLLPRTGLLCV